MLRESTMTCMYSTLYIYSPISDNYMYMHMYIYMYIFNTLRMCMYMYMYSLLVITGILYYCTFSNRTKLLM